MKFSGTTVLKSVTEWTPQELSTWNFGIVIFQVIPGNLQKYVSTNRSLLQCKTSPAHFSNMMMVQLFIERYLKARWVAVVPSEELRTVLWMFVILLTANCKFRNRSTCSKGPIKRASKVCGDSQDLESPGCIYVCHESKDCVSPQGIICRSRW